MTSAIVYQSTYDCTGFQFFDAQSIKTTVNFDIINSKITL